MGKQHTLASDGGRSGMPHRHIKTNFKSRRHRHIRGSQVSNFKPTTYSYMEKALLEMRVNETAPSHAVYLQALQGR